MGIRELLLLGGLFGLPLVVGLLLLGDFHLLTDDVLQNGLLIEEISIGCDHRIATGLQGNGAAVEIFDGILNRNAKNKESAN